MAKIFRQAVMAVILNDEGKVLIGYSPRDRSYKFPQGGLEPKEDLICGIKRELREELDYHLDEQYILSIYEEKINYPFPPDCHPVWMGQELSIVKIRFDHTTNIIPQDDEFDELHWILPHELPNFETEYRAQAYWRALEIAGLI
ncbi:NUDIX domain-containing protein [Namhaeicola litoreus]|uniref:NUDIX domain-containing protein n=1 Tax=Namhaeicola litoreus TaxID=1052145 RepID=A0ABW3Y3F9_9FLAO